MPSIGKVIRIVALTIPFVSQFGVAASQAAEPETFFHNFVGLSDDQIRDVAAGKAIAKVLDTQTPDEIFVFGAKYVFSQLVVFADQFVGNVDRLVIDHRFFVFFESGRAARNQQLPQQAQSADPH